MAHYFPDLLPHLQELRHDPCHPAGSLLPRVGGHQPEGGGVGEAGHEPPGHVPGDQHDSRYDLFLNL